MPKGRIRKATRGMTTVMMTAAVALAIPTAGLALAGIGEGEASTATAFIPFTPATVDPQLARSVAQKIGAKGKAMRFTPAGSRNPHDRTVTVAVRVDDVTARAISVRSVLEAAQAEPGVAPVRIAPTRYNLGVARGYQSFVKTQQALPAEVRKIDMPDLSSFKPGRSSAPDKPSRFQPRIALEKDGNVGRSPRTLESLGEQTVDLGGSYRVLRNLDVTAGVRLSQDRDRLAPLTDAVQDSQAVYVGTQFRF